MLEGRSLDELKPDEVNVLAKVLPSFSRQDRLQVYKGVLQDVLQQGNVNSWESLEVLKNLRQELGVSDQEHLTILTELGIEDPDILDPSKQLTRENQLRVQSYQQALEFLVLELVEAGKPLREALGLKRQQILALKQEYGISPEEEA